jgi:hypothetical protein
MESRMNAAFFAFILVRRQGEAATCPLARPVAHLPLYPQGVGRIRKAAKAATTALSLVVAGNSLPPPRFALKDSDPLRAEAHVESYAAVSRPDAPSGTSNYSF